MPGRRVALVTGILIAAAILVVLGGVRLWFLRPLRYAVVPEVSGAVVKLRVTATRWPIGPGGALAEVDPERPIDAAAVATYLAGERQKLTAAGGTSRVVVETSASIPFDRVGQVLLRAAFRAGYRASEVEYKPVDD